MGKGEERKGARKGRPPQFTFLATPLPLGWALLDITGLHNAENGQTERLVASRSCVAFKQRTGSRRNHHRYFTPLYEQRRVTTLYVAEIIAGRTLTYDVGHTPCS